MAAKPFILTIDSGRLFCYPKKIFCTEEDYNASTFFKYLQSHIKLLMALRYTVCFIVPITTNGSFIAGGGEDNETPLEAAKEKPLKKAACSLISGWNLEV